MKKYNESSSMETFFPKRRTSNIVPISTLPEKPDNAYYTSRDDTPSNFRTKENFTTSRRTGKLMENKTELNEYSGKTRKSEKSLHNTKITDPSLSSSSSNTGLSGSNPKNYKLIYDPELSKSKSRGSKPLYRFGGEGSSDPKDPRYVKSICYPRTSRGKKAFILSCPSLQYSNDENSVAPETHIILTGLSTLTQKSSIMSQLSTFGTVEDFQMKFDPSSQEFLGICHFRFKEDKPNSNKLALQFVSQIDKLIIDSIRPSAILDYSKEKIDSIVNKALESKKPIFKTYPDECTYNIPFRNGTLPPNFKIPGFCIFISSTYIDTNLQFLALRKWLYPYEAKNYYVNKDGFYLSFPNEYSMQRVYKKLNKTYFLNRKIYMDMFYDGIVESMIKEIKHKEALAKKTANPKQIESHAQKLTMQKAFDSVSDSDEGKIDIKANDEQMKLQTEEAVNHIINDLRSFMYRDIRERVQAPAIVEFLHPNRFEKHKPKEKREAFDDERRLSKKDTDETVDQSSSLPVLPHFKKRVSYKHLDNSKAFSSNKFLKKSDKPSKKSNEANNKRKEPSESSTLTKSGKVENSTISNDKNPLFEIEKLNKSSLQESEPDSQHQDSSKLKRKYNKDELYYSSTDGEVSDLNDESTDLKSTKKPKLHKDNTSSYPESFDENTVMIQKPDCIKTDYSQPTEIILVSPEQDSHDESDSTYEFGKLATILSLKPSSHPLSITASSSSIRWQPTEGQFLSVCDDSELNNSLDINGIQSLVKDKEDYAFLQKALSFVYPEDIGNADYWAWNNKEMASYDDHTINEDEVLLDNNDLEYQIRWTNKTGSSRSEGYSKIADADKSAYLPHRKKIHVPIDTIQESSDISLTSTNRASNSRHNRASNRRLANDINLQKQMLSNETDILNFNQLMKRKKPVKFARSAIHNWGLYAIEPIAANEMIIEYVGEVVRQKVAEIREKKYLRSGIGSSYLFRIDEQTVIDATMLGGIARFINHCCTPSCTAKIIKVEGKKRIVIYALRDIAANEELTYDYKFEREANDEERIPCLCGSTGCKGFLN